MFPSPDGLLVWVHHCHFRDACHPTIWPQNSGFILLCIPQILCPAWSSLVATYIFSSITCHSLQLMTLGCNHSRHLPVGLPTHSSRSLLPLENTYAEVSSARKTSHYVRKQSNFYTFVFYKSNSLLLTSIILLLLHSSLGFRIRLSSHTCF